MRDFYGTFLSVRRFTFTEENNMFSEMNVSVFFDDIDRRGKSVMRYRRVASDGCV